MVCLRSNLFATLPVYDHDALPRIPLLALRSRHTRLSLHQHLDQFFRDIGVPVQIGCRCPFASAFVNLVACSVVSLDGSGASSGSTMHSMT